MNQLALGGIAAVVIIVATYQAGGNAERKRGEVAALRTQIATMQADQANTASALASETAKAAALDALTQQQETELDALRTQLNALPADQRPVAGRDALDRLYLVPH